MKWFTGEIWDLKVSSFICIQIVATTLPEALTSAKRRCPVGNSLFWSWNGLGSLRQELGNRQFAMKGGKGHCWKALYPRQQWYSLWCQCQKKKSWRLLLWTGFSTTTAKPSLQTDEFEKLILYLFAHICYDADSGSGPSYDEFYFLTALMFANVRLHRYGTEWKVGLTT